jgi:predicted aspartyl protease
VVASAFGRSLRVWPSAKPPILRVWAPAFAVALLLAVVGVGSPVMAAVDDEPAGLTASSATLAHVRTLYDRAHTHEHTRAATVIEDWRLFQDGTVGSYHVNRLGKDIRETTTLGPLVYQRGVRGAVHWEQNRNGIVYTYPGVHELRDAASERAFRDSGDDRDVKLVGDSLALNAYVVELNPPAGRHEWLFVDKRTGYIIRREYVERRRRYATSYDDYKLVEGVPEPSRTRTVDSLGNEREQILLTRSLDTTPDLKDVDIPAPRRVVEFPEKQQTVRLPVRFVNGLAIVRVIVGRVGYDFLLDSGAAGIVIDPSVAQQQGLERYGQRLGATLGTFPESTTIVPQMTIGGLRMRNIVTRVVSVPFHVDDRTHVAGLLGFDFFADTIVHVDLQRNLAEALSPDHFRPPADATTVNVGLDDKTPAVTARAGSASGRVVLDTGANRSVFETAFAERGDFSPDRVASTTHVRGMGGYANAEPTRVPTFELGGIWIREVTADVSNVDLGTEDVDGIVGTDLLRSYELWFDYRANAVYLRKSKR